MENFSRFINHGNSKLFCLITKASENVAQNFKRCMGTRRIMRDDKLKTNWPSYLDDGKGCAEGPREGRALLLGIYTSCSDQQKSGYLLTRAAYNYDMNAQINFPQYLKASGPVPRLGEARLFFNVDTTFPIIAICGLGNQCYGYNANEGRDELKEAVRLAVGAGCQACQNLDVSRIYLESFGNTEAAAEGAVLSLWVYQDLKNKYNRIKIPYIGLFDDADWVGWQIGMEKGGAQNLARQLMETPSNLMTPTSFALSAVEALCSTGVSAHVKVKEWAKENEMNGFLSISKGSSEEPMFLELLYNGCDPCVNPLVLIGMGITFDAGGLCLKSREDLKNMRGDMAGAACVVATMRAVTAMKLPLNIRGLIPLCENMPGTYATKPGDVIRLMNGKTILIETTYHEGCLLLADAISYSTKYDPKFILDVGTLTPDMDNLLANSASGVFTNCEHLWQTMRNAAIHTGDRVWRLPLYSVYNQLVKPTHVSCDFVNSPEGGNGNTCALAALLKNFVYHYKWLHMDTYGVMVECGDISYLRPGMSGRPTRTLIEFLAQISCRPAFEINESCFPPELPKASDEEKESKEAKEAD